eukprot:scaffold374032_cov50-Prasinocladus_malaysianus.AAC.1
MPLYRWGRELWALARRPSGTQSPRVYQGSPLASPRTSPWPSPSSSLRELHYELLAYEDEAQLKSKNNVKLAP